MILYDKSVVGKGAVVETKHQTFFYTGGNST
jgi:hypothetical protein